MAERLLDARPSRGGQPGLGRPSHDPSRTGTAGSPGRRRASRVPAIALPTARRSRRRRSRPRRRRGARQDARTPPRRRSRRCRRSTRARAPRSSSTVQSSSATPTIGQSSRPRRSSRYSDRNVITLARSPVIPNTTITSAGCGSLAPASGPVVRPLRGDLAVTVMLLPRARFRRAQAVRSTQARGQNVLDPGGRSCETDATRSTPAAPEPAAGRYSRGPERTADQRLMDAPRTLRAQRRHRGVAIAATAT